MTYGDTTSDLRQVMSELLRRHRILQPLGGPGIHSVPETTTVEQRREMGEEIQRYRHATLLWCYSATAAVSPKFDRMSQGRGPADELRRWLGDAVEAMTLGRPSLHQLVTPHPNALVDSWRRAARSAVLGEHDFPAGIDFTRLDAAESLAVLKDAADFTRGLVILDKRYRNIPGWELLNHRIRLARAAEDCSRFAAPGVRDYSVDRRGWRPPPASIEGPALPGISGVIQAQHNMLVDLTRFPTALNLRRILRSQADLAHEAARHAASAAPELVERFLDREHTYKLLQKSSRNLGGLVGNGGVAAAESQNAQGRFKRLPMSGVEDAPALHELAKLFRGTDARIASTIERGLDQKLYFVSVKYPRLGEQEVHGVAQPRERWIPVTSPVQTDLLPLVRARLRPFPCNPAATPEAIQDRHAYELLLTQQPGARPTFGYSR